MMTMSNNGISKLIEETGELQKELGELQQILGKLLAYPDGGHPDGRGNLYERLEDEMADVLAAIGFVSATHRLNVARMQLRRNEKERIFIKWHEENK